MKRVLIGVLVIVAFAVNAFAGETTTIYNSTGNEVIANVRIALESAGFGIVKRELPYGVVKAYRAEKELTFGELTWRDDTRKFSRCVVKVEDYGDGKVLVNVNFTVGAVFADGTIKTWEVNDPDVYNTFFSALKRIKTTERELYKLTHDCLS